MDEYRLLNGWSKDKKRGSSRYDRMPLALFDEILIEQTQDFLQLVPYTLEEPLTHMQILSRAGKRGREYLYEVAPQYR